MTVSLMQKVIVLFIRLSLNIASKFISQCVVNFKINSSETILNNPAVFELAAYTEWIYGSVGFGGMVQWLA